MKIISDFDSCINLCHQAVLDLYREITGDCSSPPIDDENVTWRMDGVCPKWSKDEVDLVFENPRLFELMKPMPNAIETLKKLHDEGHEIIIATVHRANGIPYKSKWIREHLPFINTIIFLDNNIKMDKSMIYADVIIDDHPSNILTSICKYKLLFGNYSWQEGIDYSKDKSIIKTPNWDIVYKAISQIKKGDI